MLSKHSDKKLARNRRYAQTSRERHRAYVSSLEERLERLESENEQMRQALLELGNKYKNGSGNYNKCNDNDTDISYTSHNNNDNNTNDSNYSNYNNHLNYTNYTNYTNLYTNSLSHSTSKSPSVTCTNFQFALSVLD
jgi:hypothetical protein